MEMTRVARVISELKSVSRLNIFQKLDPGVVFLTILKPKFFKISFLANHTAQFGELSPHLD